MKANRKAQTSQVTFNNEAEFEKAVLQRLSELLPHTLHEAVHACLVKDALESDGAAPSGRKIQNGVREPKYGGKCYTVWKRLDVMREGGMEPTLQEVLAIASAEGWNANNARIEYYNWRRFHGYGAAQQPERRKSDRRVHQVKLHREMKNRRTADRRLAA